MIQPRTITLADREIDVPALPLRINRIAYPLCRKINNNGFPERYLAAAAADVVCEVSNEEFADLAEVAFLAAQAADRTLDRETFDEWPISPPELLNAYFPIRIQTGGWIAGSAEEAHTEPGEAKGAKKPRK